MNPAFFLAVGLLVLPGCAAMYANQGSKPGTVPCYVQSEGEGWGREADGAFTKAWDLGTGSAEQILRESPKFYGLWDRPFDKQPEERRKQPMDTTRRDLPAAMDAGGRNPDHISWDLVTVANATVVSFRPASPNPEPKVRAWTPGGNSGELRLFVTWRGCARMEAVDRCENEVMTMSMRVTGTGSCVPDEAPLLVEYTLNQREQSVRAHGQTWTNRVGSAPEARQVSVKEGAVNLAKVEPNEAATGQIPVRLLDQSGEQLLWQGSVTVGDFSNPTRQEVTALFAAGEEKLGRDAYQELSVQDASFDAQVAKARADGIQELVRRCEGTPFCFMQADIVRPKGSDLPGDDEVRKVLVPSLIKNADAVQGNDGDAMVGAGYLLMAAFSWEPKDQAVLSKLAALEARFGPKLADGTISDPNATRLFEGLFPNSQYLDAKSAHDASANQAAAADRENRRLARIWEDVEEYGDDVAIKRFRARLARQISPSRQTMAGAARMEQHAQAILHDDFCPAKKRFIQASSRKVYDEWARNKCQNNPPTTSGRDGDEVTLTQDCRAVYATACP